MCIRDRKSCQQRAIDRAALGDRQLYRRQYADRKCQPAAKKAGRGGAAGVYHYEIRRRIYHRISGRPEPFWRETGGQKNGKAERVLSDWQRRPFIKTFESRKESKAERMIGGGLRRPFIKTFRSGKHGGILKKL